MKNTHYAKAYNCCISKKLLQRKTDNPTHGCHVLNESINWH